MCFDNSKDKVWPGENAFREKNFKNHDYLPPQSNTNMSGMES